MYRLGQILRNNIKLKHNMKFQLANINIKNPFKIVKNVKMPLKKTQPKSRNGEVDTYSRESRILETRT